MRPCCIGTLLGGIGSRIAIQKLLERIPKFWISEEHHEPAGARRFRFEPTYSFRSLADLHIGFDPIEVA